MSTKAVQPSSVSEQDAQPQRRSARLAAKPPINFVEQNAIDDGDNKTQQHDEEDNDYEPDAISDSVSESDSLTGSDKRTTEKEHPSEKNANSVLFWRRTRRS